MKRGIPIPWAAAASVVLIVLLAAATTARSQRATPRPATTYVLGPVGVVAPQEVRLNMVNAGPATCRLEWKISAYGFDPRFSTAVEEASIGDIRTVISGEAAFQSANSGFYGGLECLNTPGSSCVPALVAQVKVASVPPDNANACAVGTTLEVIEDGKTAIVVQPTKPFPKIPIPDPPPR